MPTRTLQKANDGKAGLVNLDKRDLELDGLVDDDGTVQDARVSLDRLDTGRYEVVVLDDHGQPLHERA